jgi:hypothetical protein
MFRCYNGAWDSDALALFAEEDRAISQLKKLHGPDVWVTYHSFHTSRSPAGWVAHVWGKDIGPFRATKLGALNAALELSQEKIEGLKAALELKK